MNRESFISVLSLLSSLVLSLPPLAAGDVLYQTGFEPPTFTPGLLLRDQDDWRMFHDPEAISVSAANAHTGAQCLRFDGALLVPLASGHSNAYCWSGALGALADNPPPIIEVTASVRLDGPQTGTLGTPDQDLMSANLEAMESRPDGRVYRLGGFGVSSAGRIFAFSDVPEDNYKYSVPYTFGTCRRLTLRVDFLARRVTWIVDGEELGSGAFPPDSTADPAVQRLSVHARPHRSAIHARIRLRPGQLHGILRRLQPRLHPG